MKINVSYLLVVLIIVYLLCCASVGKCSTIHELRVKKCEILIKAFYNHEGRANFLPHVEYFISHHEAYEGNPNGKGFGATWYWSLVYGGANFSMRCYATAPGNCAGPLDVKHYPLVRDPQANIRHHCAEMYGFYAHGVRGIDLCKHVFLPANPRDWGRGRFRRTEKKHRDRINLAYQRGELVE